MIHIIANTYATLLQQVTALGGLKDRVVFVQDRLSAQGQFDIWVMFPAQLLVISHPALVKPSTFDADFLIANVVYVDTLVALH